MLKYKYIFQIKYTEAILPNSTWKLLSFEIIKMLIAVLKIKFIVPFIITFGTLSFPVNERVAQVFGRREVGLGAVDVSESRRRQVREPRCADRQQPCPAARPSLLGRCAISATCQT